MSARPDRRLALSVFHSSGGDCSSGSPVIVRPLVSDRGLPSGFTSKRPWAGCWTPKLLLTSRLAPVDGAISVRMCVWMGRASVGPNSTFTTYWTFALNSRVLTLLFTRFAPLIQRFSCNATFVIMIITVMLTAELWPLSSERWAGSPATGRSVTPANYPQCPREIW